MTLGIALASFAFSPPAGSKLAQPPKGLAELALPVLAAGVLAVASGLAIWKPVQFGVLARLLGDFDTARVVHFVAMSTIVGFVVVHVAMSVLVPRSLLAMLRGR